MSERSRRLLITLITLLAMWELVTRFGLISPIIIPPPFALIEAAAKDGMIFLRGFLVTTAEVAVATAIAWTLGIAVGLIAGSLPRGAAMTGPVLSSLFAVPLIILYPLFMAWVGIGPTSKVLFGVLSGFFPIALNTLNGVRAVEQPFITMARAMGASRGQIYFRVLLPMALPSIVSGLRVGTGLVIIGVVVTEMLASVTGLGFLISYHRTLFDTGHVYLGIALALLLAVGVNVGLSSLERHFGRWRILERAEH